MAATYEYRDGALWLRLDGLGDPAEMHASLLEVLAVVLKDLDGQYNEDYLPPLHWLLVALLPTEAHLRAGWEVLALEASKKKKDTE
jgi:hypothetical protein